MKKNILVVAGEPSGDMHASDLIRKLKELDSGLFFFGIGGSKMEAVGVNLVERIEKLSIIGISEVFFKLHHVYRAFRKIMQKAQSVRPDLAILVDYPGFNLKLAKALKKRKIPVVYYITPQVWAWGKSRIGVIKKYVDKAIVILKFEEDLFREYGVDATFVGHPLLDHILEGSLPDKKSLGLDKNLPTIALLPGSRESEVKNMLPVMAETSRIISRNTPAQFVLLKSSAVHESVYANTMKKCGLAVPSIKDNTYGCLGISDFIFTTSGTATLECALMERPMLITYKASLITMLLFKFFGSIRKLGLVNIIAKKDVAPEILQYDATPPRLAKAILSFILSKEKRDKQISELRKVKALLGTPGAALRAARIIHDLLR